MAERNEAAVSNSAGKWLGWIGIILGLIGFFWQPAWVGIPAIILGIIGVFSPQKALNWTAIALGAIAIVVGLM